MNRTLRAFTLIELLVVLGILALLAAIAIPRFSDVVDRTRSSTQAFSLADVSRQVEIYYATNRKYPEGWDLLLENSGTLFTKLTPEAKAFMTLSPSLSADQLTSLRSAGISHVFYNSATATDPSKSGGDRHHLGDAATPGHDGSTNVNVLAAIDETAGSKGFNLLVNDFGLNPNRPEPDTGTGAYPRLAANTYVVFGLSYKSSMVQSQLQDVAFLEHTTSATAYSRALVVFEIPNTGTAKARMVGVFGPDGRSKSIAIQDYNNVNGGAH